MGYFSQVLQGRPKTEPPIFEDINLPIGMGGRSLNARLNAYLLKCQKQSVWWKLSRIIEIGPIRKKHYFLVCDSYSHVPNWANARPDRSRKRVPSRCPTVWVCGGTVSIRWNSCLFVANQTRNKNKQLNWLKNEKNTKKTQMAKSRKSNIPMLSTHCSSSLSQRVMTYNVLVAAFKTGSMNINSSAMNQHTKFTN